MSEQNDAPDGAVTPLSALALANALHALELRLYDDASASMADADLVRDAAAALVQVAARLPRSHPDREGLPCPDCGTTQMRMQMDANHDATVNVRLSWRMTQKDLKELPAVLKMFVKPSEKTPKRKAAARGGA